MAHGDGELVYVPAQRTKRCAGLGQSFADRTGMPTAPSCAPGELKCFAPEWAVSTICRKSSLEHLYLRPYGQFQDPDAGTSSQFENLCAPSSPSPKRDSLSC